MVPVRRLSYFRHPDVGNFYNSISLYSIVIWTLYAVVWGLADENQLLNVDTEIILYAVVPLPQKRL